MLTGSDLQRGRKFHSLPSGEQRCRCGGEGLNHCVIGSEQGKPVSLPRGKSGREVVDDSGAGKGGESKRKPLCNRSGYGPCCPARKRAHFSLVFLHERDLTQPA